MARSSLETLPAELRIQILQSLPDVLSLRSLIYASPTFHNDYLKARQVLFGSVVVNELGPDIIVDALATLRSRNCHVLPENGAEEASVFLDQYRHARGAASSSSSCSGMRYWTTYMSLCRDLDETIFLLHQHKLLERIVVDYCQRIKMPMVHGPQLSRTERTRLFRAMYRFQTYCNLYGGRSSHRQLLYKTAPREIRRRLRTVEFFAPSFTPWEVEEMGSIWKYVAGHCCRIIAELDTDIKLRSLSPYSRERFGSREVSPNRSRHSSPDLIAYNLEEVTDSLVSLGLEFLERMLGAKSCEKHRDLVLDHIADHCYHYPFRLAYNSVSLPCLLVYPADTLEDERILNAVSSLPETEQPSEGWKWYCSLTDIPALGVGPDMWDVQGIRYLSLVEHPELLDLGYVFWDRKRLEEWNIVVAMPAKKKRKKKQRANRPLPVGNMPAVDAGT